MDSKGVGPILWCYMKKKNQPDFEMILYSHMPVFSQLVRSKDIIEITRCTYDFYETKVVSPI